MFRRKILFFLVPVLVAGTVLFLGRGLPRKQAERNNFSVAMNVATPGYFTFGEEGYGYLHDLLGIYARNRNIELRIVSDPDSADMTVTTDGKGLEVFTTDYVVLSRGGVRPDQAMPYGVVPGGKMMVSSAFLASGRCDALADSLSGTEIVFSRDNCFEMIEALAGGYCDYVVCERSEANMGCALTRGVAEIAQLDPCVTVRVEFASDAKDLSQDFSRWLARFAKGREYAELKDLYYGTGIVRQMLNRGGQDAVSVFDNVIRKVARNEGLDWRLLLAIAYQESRFDPYLTSPRGACGLMQVMPAVAGQFGVDRKQLMDPETNVLVAAKVLNRIGHILHIPRNSTDPDRMAILLACYNGGIGHVGDARRLASKYGENPNSWDNVAKYLALKSQPEYYGDDVVRCGSFTGSGETIAFVGQVIRKYDVYCRQNAEI